MKREQAIFDAAAVHLLTQNARSEAKGACAYRGPRGTMCAIGALISDEDYLPNFEGMNIRELLRTFPEVLGFKPSEFELSLMTKLQCTHDNLAPHEWATDLRDIAAEASLNSSVVNDFEVKNE